MYYLTYRPRTIGELDNTQVRINLTALLTKGAVPHALLLIGHKGMGKTSTARIIAKAVNCRNNRFAGITGQGFEPCNTCEHCLSVDSNTAPDVTEMDAASNRGIDDIRQLVHDSVFAPLAGRHRVYIIDEAHMITSEGFNALLKTLEEPASSAIFILATTHEDKIPATIASRCIRIAFGTAENADIAHMLDRIARHEKITLSPQTQELIVSHADKSFRDAAKLLEELVTHNALDTAKATTYLGVSSGHELLTLLQQKRQHEIFAWLSHFDKQGSDVRKLIEELLEMLRIHLLHLSGVSASHTRRLSFSRSETLLLLKNLHEAYRLLKISPLPILPLEIVVADFLNVSDNEKARNI